MYVELSTNFGCAFGRVGLSCEQHLLKNSVGKCSSFSGCVMHISALSFSMCVLCSGCMCDSTSIHRDQTLILLLGTGVVLSESAGS